MFWIFVNKEHKLRRSLTLFVWGPIQTLIGFVLLYVVTSLIFGFLNGILSAEYFTHNNITVGAVVLIAIAYFYLMALAKVKAAYVGQPTLLGARQKWFVLPEGYSLLLPWPFMGYREIPIQPTTTALKDPMEILVSKQPEKNGGTQPSPQPVQNNSDEPLSQVRMKISMSIMWEVDPVNILSYTSVEKGKEGVETALVEVMRRGIREKAQHLSDTEVFIGQKAFEDAVRATLAEKLDAEKLEDDPENLTLVHKLGIKIIKVQTVKIVPSDEELTKKYERLRGEDLDQQAETKQARHIIDNLALPFKNKLSVDGDVALHAALAITKDAKFNVVTGNAGDFTKGNVVASQGGK